MADMRDRDGRFPQWWSEPIEAMWSRSRDAAIADWLEDTASQLGAVDSDWTPPADWAPLAIVEAVLRG